MSPRERRRQPLTEKINLHGTGETAHEVYAMPPHPDYWPAVTDVPCPVARCPQTVVWYEAGYVPGYRVCMQSVADGGYAAQSLRHRFLADGTARAPVLVRDECCEGGRK